MNRLTCQLCPHHCSLAEGQTGRCRVRKHQDGALVSTVYGLPSAVHLDPIEKKPLFHMLPGSRILSLGTAGCNLRCAWCQNWTLSQRGVEEMEVVYRAPPETLIDRALENDCPSIALTYSEPVVFYEYSCDIAKLAKERGLRTVLVTAAYIEPEPLRALAPYVTAANVDLKGFEDAFYVEHCAAHLEPVKTAIKVLKSAGVWVELTNLLIPTLNDDQKKIAEMAKWIAGEVGPETPLHFSRFHPDHRTRNLPATPPQTLIDARKTAKDCGLQNVYIGNLRDLDGESTFCPKCNARVLQRNGYRIVENRLRDGCCPDCGQKIPGVWK